jgi:hypothetical protein
MYIKFKNKKFAFKWSFVRIYTRIDEKQWSVRTVFYNPLKNYRIKIENEITERHLAALESRGLKKGKKYNLGDWKRAFTEKFVVETNPEEHPFVAFYNEEENKFEFWNAYKVEDFISSLLYLQKKELVEKIKGLKLSGVFQSKELQRLSDELGENEYIETWNELIESIISKVDQDS